MRRPRQTLAAALLLPLLAGCGGAPQASDPPTPAARDSEKSNPSTSTEQTLPLTKSGAIAFVRDYISDLNDATSSGEVSQLRDLDDGSCESCRATLGAIRRIHQNGGQIEGGSWAPEVLQGLRRDNGWVIDLRIQFEPQTVIESEGSEPEKYDGGEGLASFIVREVDGEWRLDEWTRAD